MMSLPMRRERRRRDLLAAGLTASPASRMRPPRLASTTYAGECHGGGPSEQRLSRIDAGGVGIVVVGVLVATVLAVRMLLGRQKGAYESYRRLLGRSILLGLEFLVAADIIRTVAVTPTFRSVGVLAVIVVIRTFLSFSLELEITGRWPWQKKPEPAQQG